MTDEQEKRGEKIASGMMRVLAITGLVAILALAAWLLVQSAQVLPRAGNGLQAAVAALQSVFSNAPTEDISFSLEARTFATDEQATMAWEYIGDNTPEEYSFSYSCVNSVTLSIKTDMGWIDHACDTSYTTASEYLQIMASSPAKRFVDIELTVEANDLSDMTLVTIVNNAANPDAAVANEQASDTPVVDEPEDTPAILVAVPATEEEVATVPATTVSTPAPAPVVHTVSVPVTRGPSDLRINIDETGVLVPVAGKDTFFPISPIPSDRTGAVTFTVTNLGGVASGAWGFVANLPTEGDSDYRYVSPIQASLPANTRVTFTLGFTDILQASEGTIRIEILPADSNDKETNNIDAVSIDIKEK